MTMFGSSIDFLTQQAKDITQTNRQSIARIATGGDAQKLAAMDRKTGNLGRVIRISTDNMSKQDSIRFFQNAISYMQFQEETILYARQLYSQMYALAQEAQSAGLTEDELEMLNERFVDLREQATKLNDLKFNGIPLFNELSGHITYDIDFASKLFRNNGGSFKTYVNTQDVVYDKGILILDVNTGGAGEHFVFGHYESGDKPLPQGEIFTTANNNEIIDNSKPLEGINPIFDSSWKVDFNAHQHGKYTWDTFGGASTSDFDRFFIEWGPDRDTTFRFIPLSEGMAEKGYVELGKATVDDLKFENRTQYLQNLGLDKFEGDDETDWGIDEKYFDPTFADKYKDLVLQNPEKDGDRKVIFDPAQKATTEFKVNQGDVVLSKSDPSNTIMQLRVNSKTIYQVRAKYYKPPVENIEVGNKGDLNTYMQPLGLGLLRDSNNKDEGFPVLDISSTQSANSASEALQNEIDGLEQQMFTLGSSMARVVSSMNVVDKQLGIQKDLVAAEPEKVVSQELANLAKAKELRAFNASLMSKVVQINHDMINLLLG